jgi:hypothetical protein
MLQFSPIQGSYLCVGDTHIGAVSSGETDLHIKSSTGPPTSRDPPTPPASQWRLIATRLPPSSELFRLDIGVTPVGDYSNKYDIKSGDTQFIGEKLENSVEPADILDGESWRCTEVQLYRYMLL